MIGPLLALGLLRDALPLALLSNRRINRAGTAKPRDGAPEVQVFVQHHELDAIAARLARIPALVVRPSSTLMSLPISQMDPLSVGQQLLVSFVLAGIMLLLTMLGLLHLRRVPQDQEFPKVHQPERVLETV